MTTINLYQNQEERQRKISAKAANGGFLFSLGILIFTLLAYAGIKFYVDSVTKKNAVLSQNVISQNSSLAGVGSLQRILDMQTRLEQIRNNLNIKDKSVKRLKMTEILDAIEKDLSSGVRISSFVYNGKTVEVSYESNSFSDTARQLLNFKKSEYFTDATLVDVTRGEKSITAKLTMKIKNL